MDAYKGPFLAVAILILLAPFGFYVKQFTQLNSQPGVSVEFNPMECYACVDCPCKYTLNDTKDFVLSSNDKSLCKIPYEHVQKGITDKSSYMKIRLEPERYKNLFDCLSWYSTHPSYAKNLSAN